MSVSLSKGGNVSLSKAAPTMKNVLVGLGWDARSTDGQDFDLDASAFLLAANGKVRGDADFIFYNNLKSSDGSVTHTGDNRTGQGDGDDESLKIKLDAIPADVDKIIFVVTIHDARARRQSFGQVSGAFIRLVNDDNQTEVARYDLTEDASTETAMLFGELYRHNTEWKFRAVGRLCRWSGFRLCAVRHQRILIIKLLFSLFSRGVGHPAPTSTISRSDKMAVSLVKGGNVSLTKEAPSMNVALVGLGWDARVTDGQAFDLDASVFRSAKMEKCCPTRTSFFITTPPARTARYSTVVTTARVKATETMSRSKSSWLKSALTLKTGVCCHYS